jgi:hypothetical protein
VSKIKVASLSYILIVLVFSVGGIAKNVIRLSGGKQAVYNVNPFFLSGTLLLFDRSFFFESRLVQVHRKNGQVDDVDFDSPNANFNSYVQRRLFRMVNNELKCGINAKKAIQDLYCQTQASGRSNEQPVSIEMTFISHLTPVHETKFSYSCEARDSE